MNEIRLDTAELDRLAAGLGKGVIDIVTGLAFEIEAEAKTLAPVETGALRASIYTNGKQSSSSPEIIGDAETEAIPTPSGDVIAVVGSGIEYAAYQELGTSKMAAQPYLYPAVEHKSAKLNSGEMWRKLFEHQ
jgi:HK97 gp10 family phage protein